MRVSVSNFRSTMPHALLAALLAAGVVAASGCSWFRKGDELYAQSPEQRPLEVPPELEVAQTVPEATTASQRQASATAATSATGFAAPGTRDAVFAQVGEALATVEGVTITAQAQALGAYDVGYEGSSFLVRVAEAKEGSFVSAVDARGVPAAGEAPRKLIEALKAKLAP